MLPEFPSRINLDQLEPSKSMYVSGKNSYKQVKCPYYNLWFPVFETRPDFNSWVRFPIVNGFLRLAVIPKSDIKISLSSRPKDDPGMIVISLGYLDDMRSAIGTIEVPFSVEKTTPNILKRNYNEFWIVWVNGVSMF